jgi:hypothetical protein
VTAIGFLLFALSVFIFIMDSKGKAANLIGALALGGTIFMVGGIFRFLWQVMP